MIAYIIGINNSFALQNNIFRINVKIAIPPFYILTLSIRNCKYIIQQTSLSYYVLTVPQVLKCQIHNNTLTLYSQSKFSIFE